MGVRRAVDIVLDIARRKGEKKIYTYGQLIHNPQTIELLEKRGIVAVSSIDDIDGGVVVIRAHGISPDERKRIKKKSSVLIDATCPKVARVQGIIKKHAEKGYFVIIIGDSEHPEVSGLLGYAGSKGTVIADEWEISELPEMRNVCVVAQTTQNSKHFDFIAHKIKKRFPDAIIFNTICDSTERRQAEVEAMTGEMDAMIIVGGKNSANTQRLAEISREKGMLSFHIETAEELKNIDLKGAERIGVSAGASTPNWITDSVVDYLTFNKRARKRKLKWLYNSLILCVQTDLYSALGAASLTAASMFVQGEMPAVISMLIAAFYVYAIHTINRLQDRYLGRITGGFRDETYVRHRSGYMAVAVSALIFAMMLSMAVGVSSFLSLFVLSLLGMLYNIVVFPGSMKLKRLRDIPGSKNIFMAAAWAVVTAVIPVLETKPEFSVSMIFAFIFVFSIVFVKSAFSDLVDVQSDRLVGRETIPVVIGEQKVRELIKGISVALACSIFLFTAVRLVPFIGLALMVPVFYIWICLELYDKKAQFSSAALEGLFGTSYIIAGASTAFFYLCMRVVP